MNTEDKKHFPYQAFIIGALFLSFSPAILNVYFFHDDLFFWDQPSSRHVFPLICSESIYLGRFLGAVIFWSYFFIVKTVSDLNFIRLITSLVMAYCSLRVYGLLLKYLKRPIDAALSSVILFSLPAFGVWVFHAGESFEVYALVFVIIAAYAADRIPLQGHLLKRITSHDGLVTIFSLVLSWMIYPSLAAFYWPMALILILSQMEEDGKDWREKIGNIYFPGITAALFYACLYKLRIYFIKLTFISAYQPDTMTTDLADKCIWLFFTVIPQCLNLWNIFPNNFLPVFFFLFFAGAVIITLVEGYKIGFKQTWSKAMGFLLAALSILILSYLPNLLAAVNFNPYRCAAGLGAACVILLIWALRTYCRFFPDPARSRIMTLILGVVCLWGIGSSFYNIDRFRVQISRIEYSFLRDSLANFHGKLKEIYLVTPRFNGFYHFYDEYGVCPFYFDNHANAVRLMNAIITGTPAGNNMIWDKFSFRYFYKEQVGPQHSAYSLLKIKVTEDTKIKLSDSTLLIDMNVLYGPFKQAMGRHYNFKVINKRSWGG